jgi:rod shape-determining protein MreD
MERVKKIFFVLIFGMLAVYLQGSVLRIFLPEFLVPDLMLSLVVFLAFYENSAFGAFLAFILGLQFDLYAGQQLLVGPTAGALVAVFGMLSSLSQRIFVESVFAIFIVSIVSAVMKNIIQCALLYEFNSIAIKYFSLSILGSFVTACVTPMLFYMLLGLRKRSGKKNIMVRSRMASV